MPVPPKGYIVYTEEAIQQKVSELAETVSEHLRGRELTCLVVLNGAFFFAADLIRQLRGFKNVEISFTRLQSYAGSKSSGNVTMHGGMPPVGGRHVLVIEDLMDTGLTLSFLRDGLRSAGAQSVTYVVLVDKKVRTTDALKPDFVGFELETEDFLFGYGMDHEGRYRELPYIAAFDLAQEYNS